MYMGFNYWRNAHSRVSFKRAQFSSDIVYRLEGYVKSSIKCTSGHSLITIFFNMTLAKDASRSTWCKTTQHQCNNNTHLFPKCVQFVSKKPDAHLKTRKEHLLTEGAGDIFVPNSMVSSVGESLVTLQACFGGC